MAIGNYPQCELYGVSVFWFWFSHTSTCCAEDFKGSQNWIIQSFTFLFSYCKRCWLSEHAKRKVEQQKPKWSAKMFSVWRGTHKHSVLQCYEVLNRIVWKQLFEIQINQERITRQVVLFDYRAWLVTAERRLTKAWKLQMMELMFRVDVKNSDGHLVRRRPCAAARIATYRGT